MAKQKIILGEYDSLYKDINTKALISNTTGPKTAQRLGSGTVADPYVTPIMPEIIDGHGSLHHYAFIDVNLDVWVCGDNRNNIALNGMTGNIDPVHIGIGNARQVQCYNNGAAADGIGVAILTMDGKIILVGSSEGGFANDGTSGLATQSVPFVVPNLPEPMVKIAVGGYFFALGVSGKVYQWGGLTQDAYWRSISSGRYGPATAASQDFTKAFALTFPEPIKDIVGGGDMNMVLGVSGTVYGWAYHPQYIGIIDTTLWGLKMQNLTQILKLPTNVAKIAVGTEACYLLTTDGLAYSWGNNTQAACGNGKEGNFNNQTTGAPWGPLDGVTVYVSPPYLMNSNPALPTGIKFADIWAGIGDVFYYFLEDTAGNVYAGGRNKGGVIPDGKNTGTSQDQADFPNRWDVLSPELLTKIPVPAAGTVMPPPPTNQPPAAVIAPVAAMTWPANGLQIDGTGSTDPDGSIVAYQWTLPAGATIIDPTAAKAIILFSAPGTYNIVLTVTDNNGAIGSSTMQVNVNPAPVVVPRTVTAITVSVFGTTIPVPLTSAKITFSDGSIQ